MKKHGSGLLKICGMAIIKQKAIDLAIQEACVDLARMFGQAISVTNTDNLEKYFDTLGYGVDALGEFD